MSGYDTAWPILKKFGYPFTMFVYINYINSGGKSVSWDQLAEMRDAGVDIECHTYYHDNLRSPPSLVDPPTMKLIRADIASLGMDGYMHKEVVESKQILEKQLGIKVNCIAYPVRELVAEGPGIGQGGWLRSRVHGLWTTHQPQRTGLRHSWALRGTADPTKDPKAIDMLFPNGTELPKLSKGVYELDGDTLKICRHQTPGEDRPTQIGSWPNSNLFVVTWKREKAKK